jgi:hypothetical protein
VRYLILVDEISKAENDKGCMRDLGRTLDQFDEVDIMLSSLSPKYMKNLLSGIHIPVRYVVLPPLLDSRLGMDELRKFTDSHVHRLKDSFSRATLNNLHLLASGHPRSLENMITYLTTSGTSWLDELVSDSTTTVTKILTTASTRFTQSIDVLPVDSKEMISSRGFHLQSKSETSNGQRIPKIS